MNEKITIIKEGEEMLSPEKSREKIEAVLRKLENDNLSKEGLIAAEAEINEYWKFLDDDTQREMESRVAKALRRKNKVFSKVTHF